MFLLGKNNGPSFHSWWFWNDTYDRFLPSHYYSVISFNVRLLLPKLFHTSQKLRESAAQASAWLMPSVKVSEMKGAVSKFWTQSGPSPYTHRPTMHPLLYPPIPYPVPNPSSSECFLPFQGAGSLNGSASNWVPAIACSGDLFMKQPAFTLHAPAWSSEYNRLCIVFTFSQNQHGYVG